MKKLLLILIVLAVQTESWGQVRDSARLWASRGYFNKSLDELRQIPEDSLTIEDMRLFYDNFAQLGQYDSLAYWGDKILKQDPYDVSLIVDFTPRLNKGWQGDVGKKSYPSKVIDICQKYRERDSTHILVNRQLAEAYYNIGNEAKAKELLLLVRRRSIAKSADALDETKLSGTTLRDAIYNERRLEFLGEGIRSIDIHRRGETFLKRAGSLREIKVLPTDKNYIWPIPLSETTQNKLLTADN